MAYIAKKKNREGKYYVYLVEGYREGDKVRQRTLKNYGSLEVLEKNEPGAFERLRQEAKEGKIGKKAQEELVVKFDLDSPISFEDVNYGWKLLSEIYDSLGISKILCDHQKGSKSNFNLDDVLRLLVFQRTLKPGSKLATVNSQTEMFGNWDIDYNAMTRSLPLLNEVKEKVQLQMHQSIADTIGRTATLVFYDVTNYYFEADIDDLDTLDDEGNVIDEGIRRRGPSKEKRPNPIVQLGLFMDSNGIPISYKLFRGNQTDPITYIPAIEQVKKQFGIERIVVVADKAMNSKGNTSETFKNNDGWLFSQKHRGRRGAPKEIQSFLLDAEGWEYNEGLTFAKKSMIRERKLNDKIVVKEKVLATWNKKYADREKIRRDGAIAYANKLTDAEIFRQTCKKGGKKYLTLSTVDGETGEMKAFSPFIKIDTDEVAFDEQFDGMNVLVTSEINMSDEDMLTHYRELSRIEDCFKVTKTELNARPIFVWKKEHIEAHFLSCFISLILIRIIQYKTRWRISPSRIIGALNSARANKLSQGYYRVQANEDLKQLHKDLGIKWEHGFVKFEELNKYATGWCTTKK